jgi:serine/threonine protein kinase
MAADARISASAALKVFAKILGGVEAARLLGVVRRDLKPENIFCDDDPQVLAIADFGIARFTEDQLANAVETHRAPPFVADLRAQPLS